MKIPEWMRWVLPAIVVIAPLMAVIAVTMLQDHRTKRAEVSAGMYEGMIDALRRDPSSAQAMRRAFFDDGRIDNREGTAIMDLVIDHTSTFTIPLQDRLNGIGQAQAKRRLQEELARLKALR